MPVSLIAAVAANGVIGRDGGLPWHLPADLKRFQRLTTGHHLIVGRATWESIGRPLPDRHFVVVTRGEVPALPGVTAVRSVEAGIRFAREAGDDEPFVAGGTGIFREALERDLVDRIHLTRIHRDFPGDATFPPFDESRFRQVEREAHPEDRESGRPAFDFLVYERVGDRPR
ncbi:MAG: dihydrofolate reductase [Acidobacteriota bacterium]